MTQKISPQNSNDVARDSVNKSMVKSQSQKKGFLAVFYKHELLLCILGLFLVSLSLRLLQLSHINQFGDDHGRDALYVWQHIQNGQPFVLGPKASVGNFYVLPLYYYLMAIPMWLSHGWPTSVSIMIVLVESCTPVLLFLLGRRHWSQRAGLVMGWAYALSPFGVIFSAFAWNPNMIPFFSTLMLLSVFEILRNRSRAAVVMAVVSAVMAFQLHYQAFILFFFLGPFMCWSLLRHRDPRKWWLLGIGGGLITLVPMLFDLNMTLTNLEHIWLFFRQDHSQFYQRMRLVPFLTTFIPQLFETVLGVSTPYLLLGRGLFLGSAIHLSHRTWQWYRSGFSLYKSDVLLLAFALSSLVGVRLYKGDKLEYYLLFCIFLPVIFLGSMAHRYITSGRTRLIAALLMTGLTISALWHQPRLRIPPAHDYQILSHLIGAIEARTGQESKKVVDVPYRFYRDSLRYIWLRDKGLDPFTVSAAPWHIYICQPQDECDTNQSILRQEGAAGYTNSQRLDFTEEGKVFQVVLFHQ